MGLESVGDKTNDSQSLEAKADARQMGFVSRWWLLDAGLVLQTGGKSGARTPQEEPTVSRETAGQPEGHAGPPHPRVNRLLLG